MTRFGSQLSHVSATISRMTSTSPVPTQTSDPRGPGGMTPSGEVDLSARPGGNLVAASTSSEVRPGSGLITDLWFLAGCARCGEDLAQPFRRQAERDQWAIAHLLGTRHSVSLSVDGMSADVHQSMYLRFDDDGAEFKWLCMAVSCVKWIGPYATPQLALADWRFHEATK
jgi:hypothetical protein